MQETAGQSDVGGRTTVSIDTVNAQARSHPVPGAVLVFADSMPAARVFRMEGGVLELGRSELGVGSGTDPLISRKHVRLTLDGSHVRVVDLGSRNGTFVNGQRLGSEARVPFGSLVRVGGVLLLIASDVVPFDHYGLGIRGGVVGGPSLRQALEAVARVARSAGRGLSLLIIGETGTGKEIAAQTFHGAGAKSALAPFTAVNCATIPRELAERLLFGSRRGAFSGATDAPGYVQSAHGGTLFLDEIAELPLEVQSKLLRIIETREVLRLGATSYDKVDVRLCAATWRDLRAEVAAGRFREDLYFRIGQPEARLPALRERVEEVAWHIQRAVDEVNSGSEARLSVAVGFVEACALRTWPGNVRELLGEVRRAALGAASGSGVLDAESLSATAGVSLAVRAPPPPLAQPPAAEPVFPEDEIAAAMAAEEGNVASAARRLGVHRNKVRRWLERHQVDARHFKLMRRVQRT
jgi:transcriptional regulator with AAA-type ATPase domain